VKDRAAVTAVAKKYAQAFLRVFASEISLADVGKIEIAQRSMQQNQKILFFLQLPQFDDAQRLSLIEDLVGHFALPQECVRILLLLVTHNRSFLIPEVLSFIVSLYKEAAGVVDFVVKSSDDLNQAQKEKIKIFLNDSSGKKCQCSYVIDKKLIAGIRAQSVEYIWEYSVRKQLARLRAAGKIGTY